MLERSDIEFPLWRKKVDASLLQDGTTPIPKWLYDVWDIPQSFSHATRIKYPHSSVSIELEGKQYIGHVSKIKHQGGFRFRLTLDYSLTESLRKRFLMSYMRSIEADLTPGKSNREIEREISFWEFIDIEFNSSKRHFLFTAHYVQQPQFPELFSRLAGSASMKVIQDEIEKKDNARIQKLGWKPRSEYRNEIGAENVIYMLIDTVNKLIYVGEAAKMASRFNQGHADIKDWDFYKFNALPKELEQHRVAIERMSIRDLATLLNNKQGIGSIEISDYKLANRKIDK